MNNLYLAFCISFLISVIAMPFLIPLLKRLKFGQTIREIGPSWHRKKNGTPTMGGIAFLVSTVIASLALCGGDAKMQLGVWTVAAFGIIGFADDFIKVVLKRNLGLTEMQKLFLQTAVTVVFLYLAYRMRLIDTRLAIPFFHAEIECSWFYFVFTAVLMVGFVNAVNLTDGIDGLAASVTLVVCVFFALLAYRTDPVGSAGVAVLAAAVAGGLFGFLFFNYNPAKVFMGDTGSLFLGGVVSVISVLTGRELLLLLAGLVYLIEALSVMIQVAYYKKTKKRIFLMTPIHHHFEKLGWNERKIVTVFTLVTLVCCGLGFFA